MSCVIKTRLDGKVAIVTGGGSGIGYEAAANLARYGARVIIASRNETKLKEATDRIKYTTGNQNVAYRTLDLGSLKSVRNFANDTLHLEDKVDILINNAGAVGLPDHLTEDGLNLTMQVNYFGVFLLTYLLVPMLKRSAPSRVLISTAVSMYVGKLDFEHWNEVGRFNFVTSLGNSKLAGNIFLVELAERVKNNGITVNGFDPLLVRGTDILGNFDAIISDVSKIFINIIGRDKKVVGDEIAYLATETDLDNVSGKNYKFCHQIFNHWLANDNELRRDLWIISKKLVKITKEEEWDNVQL